MEHGLERRFEFRVFGYDVTGIRVSVKSGEVAAGYLQTYLVPDLEHVARGPQVYVVLV